LNLAWRLPPLRGEHLCLTLRVVSHPPPGSRATMLKFAVLAYYAIKSWATAGLMHKKVPFLGLKIRFAV
jgi:hypothetical protein